MARKNYKPSKKYKPRECRALFDRFVEKIRITNDGCWEWLAAKRNGYGVIGQGGNGYNLPVLYSHRLSFEFFCGVIPDGLFVCHHCDNPGCVRPSHLFLGTNSDNILDAVTKGVKLGKSQRGQNNAAAKLTQEQVDEIRNLYKPGEVTYKQLATKFNISLVMVGKIIRRQNWTEK